MRHSQQNVFVRFILRAIDLVVWSYLRLSPWRWDQEPWRDASQGEKRTAAMFMALWPAALLLFFGNLKHFDAWLNTMMYGRHSMIWFYLALIGVIFVAVLIQYKIAPKVPLAVSVPVAVVMWLLFLWFALAHLI